MMNMFICACSENAEVGFAADVDIDHIDSVNDSSVCVWGGWWPESWVGGWVDGVVDCRRKNLSYTFGSIRFCYC
jgi:hypothetical protein